MMTALAMQLIQCVVKLPKNDGTTDMFLDDKSKSSKVTNSPSKVCSLS